MNDRHQDEIGRLLAEVEPAPDFPGERIRQRVSATISERQANERRARGAVLVRFMRPAAAVAAGLLIFVAGAEYGRRLATPPIRPVAGQEAQGTADLSPASRNVSFSIQERGTAYLAEVARLSESAASMTPEQLEEARQVATAILYGAALELVRAAPEDQLADAIVRSLRARRRGDDGELIWY